jgi:chemotaxis response regulator CheB
MEIRMTRNVRVLVANQPRLIRELLLETISDQPDIEVVGEVQNEADILLAVEQNRPDFLIVALDKRRSHPPVCALLLEKFPDMKILALAPERNLTVFYWASIDIHSLDLEASEEGILEVLRGPGRRAGGYQ